MRGSKIVNNRVTIAIQSGGEVRYIDPRARALAQGAPSRRRVSRVEPARLSLRLLFLAVRAVVSDESRLAAWTRTWQCAWRVRIFGGPTFGPFGERQAAIDWEITWVERHLL